MCIDMSSVVEKQLDDAWIRLEIAEACVPDGFVKCST